MTKVGCDVPLKAAAPCSVVIAQNSLNQKAEWPSSALSLRGAAPLQEAGHSSDSPPATALAMNNNLVGDEVG